MAQAHPTGWPGPHPRQGFWPEPLRAIHETVSCSLDVPFPRYFRIFKYPNGQVVVTHLHPPACTDLGKINTSLEIGLKLDLSGGTDLPLTRARGHSPSVKFPRVLGIEAVGLVEESPGGEFKKDDIVATCMGGMGRMFDGGYAQYTCVPASQVMAIKKNIPWELLGAFPEMLNTAWGSLFKSLRLHKDDHLLIRGGTTSVGLAAAVIAKKLGVTVAATTRKPEREATLKANGADEVYIETGSIAEEVKKRHLGKFTKALELVGVSTLKDTMQCVQDNGIVCLIGGTSGQVSTFYY
jgi:NADPH:quinone reductase-like Zn-dependent oxidoreductase